MSCERDFPNERVEAYAAGRLEEAAAAAFEDHYFACEACLQRLRLAQDLPDAFARPIAARQRPAWAVGLAAAASLLLAVGLWRVVPPPAPGPGRLASVTPAPSGPTRADRLRELGRFEPPAWSPQTLRGESSSPAALEAGLRRYQVRDWAGAAPLLEQAAQAAPRDPRPAFFLGATLLLEGRVEPGVAQLRRVVALGDTPYLEEAHLLLARACLRRGDGAGAERELAAVVDLQGDFEPQARELRRRLQEIDQPPGGR